MIRWLSCLMLLLCVLPARAGPWPRDPGTWFQSLTIEAPLTGDGAGWTGAYLEYGLTGRLTFGLDLGQRSGGGRQQALAFARFAPWPDRTLKMAGTLGFGLADQGAGAQPILRPAFEIGRGFETRFGAGWADADLQGLWSPGAGGAGWKFDLTGGVAPREGRLWILQLQASQGADAPLGLKIVTSTVRRIGKVEVELGMIQQAMPAPATGLKLGLWSRF